MHGLQLSLYHIVIIISFSSLSLIAVGGDGIFNEVLNGLMLQTQQQSGVNLRHPRFVPVTPNIRLGVIPTGFTNSIARSLFGSKSPIVAAAQIMLGEDQCFKPRGSLGERITSS